MKFAICNETYQDWPLEKALQHAKDTGYTGIEFAPFTLADSAYQLSPARRTEIKQLVTDTGLETVGLHWLLAKTNGYCLTSPDAEVRKTTAAYFCELANLCADLGGNILVLGSPQQRNLPADISHEEGVKYAADCLAGCTSTLSERGVTLALEPLGPEEGNFLNTADAAVALAQSLNHSNVKLHLDVKAMSTEADDIPSIIKKHSLHTAHFHANDPNRLGPGMGEVDFHPIFQALQETNYAGWVSVEVFDYSPGPDALAGDSLKYMEQVLRDLG
jgi:sugar phosphate isomerase/epimerase